MTRRSKFENGKWSYLRIDSGAKHRPEPTTERGIRRREKKQKKG